MSLKIGSWNIDMVPLRLYLKYINSNWDAIIQWRIFVGIRILLFMSMTFLKVHLHHFSKTKSHKESHKNSRNQGYSYYFCFMTEGIWTRSSDLHIRIQEAQRHTVPTDPDPQQESCFWWWPSKEDKSGVERVWCLIVIIMRFPTGSAVYLGCA